MESLKSNFQAVPKSGMFRETLLHLLRTLFGGQSFEGLVGWSWPLRVDVYEPRLLETDGEVREAEGLFTAATWKQEAAEVDLCLCSQGVYMFIMFQ